MNLKFWKKKEIVIAPKPTTLMGKAKAWASKVNTEGFIFSFLHSLVIVGLWLGGTELVLHLLMVDASEGFLPFWEKSAIFDVVLLLLVVGGLRKFRSEGATDAIAYLLAIAAAVLLIMKAPIALAAIMAFYASLAIVAQIILLIMLAMFGGIVLIIILIILFLLD